MFDHPVFFGFLVVLLILLVFFARHRQRKKTEENLQGDDMGVESPGKNTLEERPLAKEESRDVKEHPVEKVQVDHSKSEPTSEKPQETTFGVDSLLLQSVKLVKKARQAGAVWSILGSVQPDYVSVFEAGRASMSEGNWELAKKYLEEALKSSPNSVDIEVSLAIVYYELGELKTSEKFYEKILQKDPSATRAFRRHLAFRV